MHGKTKNDRNTSSLKFDGFAEKRSCKNKMT